jgi:hypothetical protein
MEPCGHCVDIGLGLTYGTPKNEHVCGLRVLFEHDPQNYFFEQLMQGGCL